jgi:DNA-binding MarR family transcriptional regulator
MGVDDETAEGLVLRLAAAWGAVERLLNGQLGSVRGISFGEYRLLRALATSPRSRASRVALAGAVGLTPSAVTRALRPLEARGLVSTVKHDRDARLALATLTPAGAELLDDAAGVVRDAMTVVLDRSPRVATKHAELAALLDELART